MTQVIDLEKPLTTDEVRRVTEYANALIAGRPETTAERPSADAEPEHRISFDGWAGCLAHVHPELSDSEFMRLIEDERIAEAMK